MRETHLTPKGIRNLSSCQMQPSNYLRFEKRRGKQYHFHLTLKSLISIVKGEGKAITYINLLYFAQNLVLFIGKNEYFVIIKSALTNSIRF